MKKFLKQSVKVLEKIIKIFNLTFFLISLLIWSYLTINYLLSQPFQFSIFWAAFNDMYGQLAFKIGCIVLIISSGIQTIQSWIGKYYQLKEYHDHISTLGKAFKGKKKPMSLSPAPHYQKAFYLEDQLGNNAFDYDLRSESHPSPQLRVAPLINLKNLDELSEKLRLSREITFSAAEDNQLKSVAGLENFLVVSDVYKPKQKIFIFDNHNHAFYFWHLSRLQNPSLHLPATLIHIDQHKDSRIPGAILTAKDSFDLEKVFYYTNHILNVGNFIPPAFKTGLIDEMILVDSEATLDQFKNPPSSKSILLDIDVDFFAPELDYIGNQKKLALIHELLPQADIITIATSPFFIDQTLAIDFIKKILRPV